MNIRGCDKTAYDEFVSLVADCGGVVISGHKNSDFDTIGACYGVYCLVKSLGKPAYVRTDLSTSLAGRLISHINDNDPDNPLRDGRSAELIKEDNLLFVLVDTNRLSLVEYPSLLQSAEHLVIIDHHQLYSELSGKDGLFIHEQNFSSACEIIAKLFSLSERNILTPLLGEALWSGIMLDTKSFTQKVSENTFYTVGALCELGARQEVISDFFDFSLEHYRERAKIVCAANIRDGYAISVAKGADSGVRIIGPQAANELLNITGVKASFVFYSYEDVLHISARSSGELDISKIMEKMGGGGNRSMAAAQLPGAKMTTQIRKLRRILAALAEPPSETDVK